MSQYRIIPEMAYAGAALFSEAALGTETIAAEQLPVLVFDESHKRTDRSESQWLELFTALGEAAQEYCQAGKNGGSRRRISGFVSSACNELNIDKMGQEITARLHVLLDTGEHFIRDEPRGPIPEPRGVANRTEKRFAEASSSTDPLLAYRKEISRYRLLSHQEVAGRAHRYDRGRAAAAQLRDGQEYDEATITQLQAEVQDGQVAFYELFTSNLRYVVSIAKRYVQDGRQIMDLITFGNKGLKRAVEKFDVRKGFTFTTYAQWWIRQEITRGIAKESKGIYLPRYMLEFCKKVEKLLESHSTDTDPPYTFVMACRDAGVSCSVKEMIEAYRIYEGIRSYDAAVGEERDSELLDYIPSSESTEDVAVRSLLNLELKNSLARLTVRESTILTERYIEGRTLEEVGRDFGVTRERIRQIEAKALSKLRQPTGIGRTADALMEEYGIMAS